MTRPSILVLAPTAPAATGGGLAMRIGVFVGALARVGRVDVVIAPLFGPPTAPALAWPARLANRVAVVDPRGRLDSHFALLARLTDPDARAEAFAHYGKPSLTAALTAEVAAEIATATADRAYDLVHVARGYMAPLALSLPIAAPGGGRPILTLDADEDDARFARRKAAMRRRQGDLYAARILDLEARAYERIAAQTLPAFAKVWVSSRQDLKSLHGSAPKAALELAANSAAPVPLRPRDRERPGHARLLFVGALGYEANHEAVVWFLRRVWPRLRHVAGLEFDIVGAAPSPALRRLARQRGVRLHGFQPDLAPFYHRATLVVAPLRTGAGTRIKIVEAAMHGAPVVATALAAEGLTLGAGRHIWLADRPEDFARAIVEALRHPQRRLRLAQAARAAVQRGNDRARIVARIAAQAETLLAART